MAEPVGLGDQEAALRIRDAMKAFAIQEFGDVHPLGRFGRMATINPDTLKGDVWYPGDPAPIEINLLADMIPKDADNHTTNYTPTSESGRGSRVWVEKINGKPYVTAVLSGGIQMKDTNVFTQRLFYKNPLWGQAGQAYGMQAGGEFAFVVPNPPSNQCVTMGPFGGPLAGSYTEIVIQDVRFSGTKTYKISGLAELSAAFTPGAFFKVAASHMNPPLDFYTDIGDFDLEIGNADFTSLWDGAIYNQMVLRIRRKNDNNPGANGEADGYRVFLRGIYGVTSQQEPIGFFPFQYWVDALSSEPAVMYGDNQYSTILGLPQTGPYVAPAIDMPRRVQDGLSGGGDYSWNGTHFKWSSSFYVKGLGAHPHTVTDGYTLIDAPPTSTVIPVVGNASVTSVTVTTNGVPLSTDQALYYKMKHGGDIFSDSSRFMIVDVTKDSMVPPTWILIAVNPGSGFLLKVGTGDFVYPFVEVTHNATQTIATGGTALAWNTDDSNRFAMHNTASNNSRLIAVVPGRYLAECQVITGAIASGVLDKVIRKGGATEMKKERHVPHTGAQNYWNIERSLLLATNEYVEFVFASTSVAAATILAPHWGQARLSYIGPH